MPSRPTRQAGTGWFLLLLLGSGALGGSSPTCCPPRVHDLLGRVRAGPGTVLGRLLQPSLRFEHHEACWSISGVHESIFGLAGAAADF